MNSLQRALAIALVVGIGLLAGFISYRLQSDRPLQPLTAPAVNVPPTGAEATDDVAPAPRPPRPVPTDVPDISLPDLAGTPRSLRSFGAHPLIINFWATWCAPCRREIPLLQALRGRYRADKLQVVGIAVDFRTAVQQYLTHTPIDYPLLVGEQEGLKAAEQFGMEMVLPFSVFADSKGHVVAVKVGELHADEADFILTEIRAVDQGQADLTQARERIQGALRELAVSRAKAQQKAN
ncbi:MAG TPA: TlpA disulfide reductase family protein [Steroidobacteraceae bacterium]